MLREALVSMGNDVHLLDKWYRKDTNKVQRRYFCRVKSIIKAIFSDAS